jgi:cytochrome b561
MPQVQPAPGFTRAQIVLHWVIAALVIFQVLVTEGIEDAWRAFERGTVAPAEATTWANVHVWIGVTIFILAIVRLGLLARDGAPPPPPSEPPALRALGSISHVALYAVILLMPVSGLLAWSGIWPEAAEIHALAKLPVILLLLLHGGAALWHHFILRTDVLRRMILPGRPARR